MNEVLTAPTIPVMIHQLRTYEIFEHNKAAFHRRFEEHAWRIMKTHGFDIVAFWDAVEDDGPVFVYLLSWPDEDTMGAAWASFMADREWAEIKEKTGAEHGKMVGAIRDHTLIPTAYSPDRIS